MDINVVGAWESGIFGDGVTIAMVDDGLQRTHPDISPNYFPLGSFDFNENDPYPDPHTGDDHGTSAGGVAAAKNNNGVCGTGAAPNAKLSGIYKFKRSLQSSTKYTFTHLPFTYQTYHMPNTTLTAWTSTPRPTLRHHHTTNKPANTLVCKASPNLHMRC